MWTTTRTTLVVTGALIVGLGWPLCEFAAQTGGGQVLAAQAARGQQRTGVFAGPIIWLRYSTPTGSGVTNEKGQFQCRDGEVVIFSVGGKVLGNWQCADRITLAHLDPDVAGVIAKMNGYRLTNMVRFVQSLDQDGIVENGVTITPKTHEI